MRFRFYRRRNGQSDGAAASPSSGRDVCLEFSANVAKSDLWEQGCGLSARFMGKTGG
jgi:hypothetical protein